MEEFWKRFDQFSGQVQAMAGQAWESMLLYKQAESIGYLAIGFICLIIAALALRWILVKGIPNWTLNQRTYLDEHPEPTRFGDDGKTTREWEYWDRERNYYYRNHGDANPTAIIPSVILAFVVAGFGIAAINCLLDIWNWIGAFVPEARLFHDLMQALTPAVTG